MYKSQTQNQKSFGGYKYADINTAIKNIDSTPPINDKLSQGSIMRNVETKVFSSILNNIDTFEHEKNIPYEDAIYLFDDNGEILNFVSYNIYTSQLKKEEFKGR